MKKLTFLSDIQNATFLVVELVILAVMAVWAVVGALNYACETHWTLKGLLTLLDERWKGSLILGVLIFYRSIREILARARKGPLGMEFGEPLEPAGQAELIQRGGKS